MHSPTTTAKGYQSLVTQLYFSGDSHIGKDPYASSASAKSRVLTVQKLPNGTNKVVYDVGMAELLPVEAATIDKLVGVYTNAADKKKSISFFKKDNTIWLKNEAFGNRFQYVGNNFFEEANNPPGYYWRLQFEFKPSGGIQLNESYIDNDLVKHDAVYLKKS